MDQASTDCVTDQVKPSIEMPEFLSRCDLAAAKNGGQVLFATDDGFAVAENMLKETEPEWREGVYTDFGKWMDGWETRRKRIAGHDWCIIKLGIPGTIQGFDVDTSYFVGNYPPHCSIQACFLEPGEGDHLPGRASSIGTEADTKNMTIANSLGSDQWETVVPMASLNPGTRQTCHNYFHSTNTTSRFTHVRLNLFPDGGVARFRVYGTPHFDWDHVSVSEKVDLVARCNGGECVGFSDAHFGHPSKLISPGRGQGMFDGWETARRLDRPTVLETDSEGHLRVTGKEWAAFRLGHAGVVVAVEVDTSHFKGNFPDFCYLEGCYASPDEEEELLKAGGERWKMIVPSQKLWPHQRHIFSEPEELLTHSTINLIRFVIAPDGGVSRLRIWGHKREPTKH